MQRARLVPALYVFIADAIRVAEEGIEAWRVLRPAWLNWPLFLVALLLMTAPFLDVWRRRRNGRAA